MLPRLVVVRHSARHAAYARFRGIDDRASPRAGDCRVCVPFAVAGTVGRRAGRPALDQVWLYRSAWRWRNAATSAQPTPLHGDRGATASAR